MNLWLYNEAPPPALFSGAFDVANFDGGSSLVFRLSVRPSRTAMEMISLKFKTLRNSGTLLHAVGQRDHSLTLVLEKGRLLLYHQQGTTLFFRFVAETEPADNWGRSPQDKAAQRQAKSCEIK